MTVPLEVTHWYACLKKTKNVASDQCAYKGHQRPVNGKHMGAIPIPCLLNRKQRGSFCSLFQWCSVGSSRGAVALAAKLEGAQGWRGGVGEKQSVAQVAANWLAMLCLGPSFCLLVAVCQIPAWLCGLMDRHVGQPRAGQIGSSLLAVDGAVSDSVVKGGTILVFPGCWWLMLRHCSLYFSCITWTSKKITYSSPMRVCIRNKPWLCIMLMGIIPFSCAYVMWRELLSPLKTTAWVCRIPFCNDYATWKEWRYSGSCLMFVLSQSLPPPPTILFPICSISKQFHPLVRRLSIANSWLVHRTIAESKAMTNTQGKSHITYFLSSFYMVK